MIITVDISKQLHKKLQGEKRRTGLSKSYIVRQILLRHFQQFKAEEKKVT